MQIVTENLSKLKAEKTTQDWRFPYTEPDTSEKDESVLCLPILYVCNEYTEIMTFFVY